MAIRAVWLTIVLAMCGCVTVAGRQPDALVDQIVHKASAENKMECSLDPELILREIPLDTPIEQARAVMQRHGFTCWSGVPEDRGICVQCTTYRRQPDYKITVKLFYDRQNHVLTNVDVRVDYDCSPLRF